MWRSSKTVYLCTSSRAVVLLSRCVGIMEYVANVSLPLWIYCHHRWKLRRPLVSCRKPMSSFLKCNVRPPTALTRTYIVTALGDCLREICAISSVMSTDCSHQDSHRHGRRRLLMRDMCYSGFAVCFDEDKRSPFELSCWRSRLRQSVSERDST